MGGFSDGRAGCPEALEDLDFFDALESFFFFGFLESGAVSSFGVFEVFLDFFTLDITIVSLFLCVSSCVTADGF